MFATGIKASELIRKLQEAIAEHGDREVYAGGTDYPEGVSGVWLKERGTSYEPEGCFVIR